MALHFLERAGNGAEGRYSNAAESAQYLATTSPDYIGGGLLMFNARLFKFWHNLPDGLRTGEIQNEAKGGGQSIFEAIYPNPVLLEQFALSMAGLSRFNARALAEKFDFSRYTTVVDVGGATGELCINLARKHAHLRLTTFDLPAVTDIASRVIANAGLSDRIAAVSGDMFNGPLPSAQVITMGMILHDWNLEKKKKLIRSAYDALPADGVFIVIESLIDDERRHSVPGLLMSLNMLIETGDGFDYSAADFSGWCTEVGFRRFERLSLAGPGGAVAAYK